MVDFEPLSYNISGIDMFTGKISPRIKHDIVVFYIVEHTNDKAFIEKEAMNILLLAGSPLWQRRTVMASHF